MVSSLRIVCETYSLASLKRQILQKSKSNGQKYRAVILKREQVDQFCKLYYIHQFLPFYVKVNVFKRERILPSKMGSTPSGRPYRGDLKYFIRVRK